MVGLYEEAGEIMPAAWGVEILRSKIQLPLHFDTRLKGEKRPT